MRSPLTQNLFTAQSMAVSATGAALDVSALATMSFSIAWSGATANNSVLKLQESLDGTNWFDITGATATLDATGKKKLGPYTVDLPKVRGVLTRTTETTGAVTATAFCRPTS